MEGEGHKYAPWGFAGGADGKTAGLQYRRASGEVLDLPSKLPNMAAKAGDRVTMIGPCGGGYGDPLERHPQQVLEDVRDGYLSIAGAKSDYGVIITAARDLDAVATVAARQSRRDENGGGK